MGEASAKSNPDNDMPTLRRPVGWFSRSWPHFVTNLPRYSVVAFVHIMVVVLWYAVTATGLVHKLILPSPGETFATLAQPQYQWLDNTMITAWEIVAGYCLAVVVGVLLALLFSWFRSLQTTLFPLFVTFSMIPKIALGPLLIVWFGYGIGTNVFFAFILSFFPILITSGRGLREVEPDLLDLVRALKGTRWQMFMAVLLLSVLGIGLFSFVTLLESIFVPKDARLEGQS